MPLKTHQLQAHFARRREQEHMRVERTSAVSRYYDHWQQQTHRFGNWTTPEYYQQAEEQVKQKNDQRTKEANTEKRRERLRQLLHAERDAQAEECRLRGRARGRPPSADTATLERIQSDMREREKIKRKLELEAKLCAKWRHGVDDPHMLFESKSDHEVLAKLNWLDEKIEERMEQEKREAAEQATRVRLQEEFNKTETVLKERQQIREQEIKEMRALQEQHMEELKLRQGETEKLKNNENLLRQNLAATKKELELLSESLLSLQPAGEGGDIQRSFNHTNIKVTMRKRCEEYRRQLGITLDILRRTSAYAGAAQVPALKELIAKYQRQLDGEAMKLSQIEGMYESEAKYNLQRCEDLWQAEAVKRYHELMPLLEQEEANIAGRLEENLARQRELIEIRSMHLAAVDNSNEKLKQLIQEEIDSPRAPAAAVGRAAPIGVAGPAVGRAETVPAAAVNVPQLSDSFTNLNLDVWQDLESPRPPSMRSQRKPAGVVAPQQPPPEVGVMQRPLFARKRVAWT